MQRSQKDLSQSVQESIFFQLTTVLADFHKPHDVDEFLRIFLTENEQTALSKRLAIARMLHLGGSYEEIKKTLNVSTATIASVAVVLASSGMQKALRKITIDEWADTIATKVTGFFKSK